MKKIILLLMIGLATFFVTGCSDSGVAVVKTFQAEGFNNKSFQEVFGEYKGAKSVKWLSAENIDKKNISPLSRKEAEDKAEKVYKASCEVELYNDVVNFQTDSNNYTQVSVLMELNEGLKSGKANNSIGKFVLVFEASIDKDDKENILYSTCLDMHVEKKGKLRFYIDNAKKVLKNIANNKKLTFNVVGIEQIK
ncbi:hypothetical protein AAEX28_08000 [Lentisphaerota bacterium WC36G]|nr:hypothetical protein LJT99_10855 [Lentisphaerae bacterium WC36]